MAGTNPGLPNFLSAEYIGGLPELKAHLETL